MSKETFYKSVKEIQAKLNVPKNQKNTFGNYSFRSAEDILSGLKPLLDKHQCFITLSDTIEKVDSRFYIKSTARLSDGAEYVEVTAYAREEDTKKGMDSSQITGAASSYARKYALNGLFAIDDNKDSDFTNTHDKTNESTPVFKQSDSVSTPSISDKQLKKIGYQQRQFGIPDEELTKLVQDNYKTTLQNLSIKEASDLIGILDMYPGRNL